MEKNKLEYKDKYNLMGVTPKELYLRQTNACWLETVFDYYENKTQISDLYCTNGKEYALTRTMCNPTFECVQCLSNYIIKLEQQKLMQQIEINKNILNILKAVGAATAQGVENKMYMSISTLDLMDAFLSNNILAEDNLRPLKVTASADIRLFGMEVILDETIPEKEIKIEPSGTKIHFK